MLSSAAASRFMNHYAKDYGAGAFAMPTAAEMSKGGRQYGDGERITLWNEKTLTRGSRRTDWIGRRYDLAPGTRIVTHVARSSGAAVPDFPADLVYCYREDHELCDGLARAGRRPFATHISAASEIITAWGYGDGLPTPQEDRVTCTAFDGILFDAGKMIAELATIDAWADDYPYYSDGSWSAVSLRGFDPDPSWGVKPAEMSRKWNDAHPGALERECVWTHLAGDCPALVAAAEAGPWTRLERVRLMKMAGQPNAAAKPKVLRRHTDITDKNAGTRDGQIIRFHIPLVTHPEIKMTTWDIDGTHTARHLTAWRAWYLDARKPHAVENPTTSDRVHLVIDAVADAGLRKLLIDAEPG